MQLNQPGPAVRWRTSSDGPQATLFQGRHPPSNLGVIRARQRTCRTHSNRCSRQKNPAQSEGHGKNGEARHKQGHGNESGNVTGKCSHDQLLLIPYVYYVCSIFVPLSITFVANSRYRAFSIIQRQETSTGADKCVRDCQTGTDGPANKKPGRRRPGSQLLHLSKEA